MAKYSAEDLKTLGNTLTEKQLTTVLAHHRMKATVDSLTKLAKTDKSVVEDYLSDDNELLVRAQEDMFEHWFDDANETSLQFLIEEAQFRISKQYVRKS